MGQKCNRCSTVNGKKKIRFCLQYYWCTWDKEIIQSHSAIIKKYVYFRFCLKYYCMGLWKNSLDLHRNKIVSDYSSTMVHGTWKKCNQTRPSPEKKILATVLLPVSGYSITMMHWTWKKNQSRWTITEINIFSFLTTELLCFTGLKKFVIGIRPHRKKKLFLAPVLDVHETSEKFSSVLYRHRKIIIFSYSATMVHGTYKLLFGMMLMFKDKHVDPIYKAFEWKKACPNCLQLQ